MKAFTSAKNQTLAMAHKRMGLVYVRRGKNAELFRSSSRLSRSIESDPVNYYCWEANKVTSHFDDSGGGLNKCATMAGPMQGTCKTQADDAKKLRDATERAEVSRPPSGRNLCKRKYGSGRSVRGASGIQVFNKGVLERALTHSSAAPNLRAAGAKRLSLPCFPGQ